ncbi:uncharacterized protein F5147DRAFT_758076 [Suillus discolor]|uniref:Uncharacterized protein n=1 Tax=Suillus discolor TaxID=1912936 RepID=A0A9P7FGV8_9AGAM|nr:uncharacterized protein F5147DRAFT_758076 [Suillus discolor]KAG2116411.1 hypothetical protein F5147DRAFT_758076 [Suillus discolor]
MCGNPQSGETERGKPHWWHESDQVREADDARDGNGPEDLVNGKSVKEDEPVDDLQVAARQGPVIILIASQYSCSAIIVPTSGDPHHVPLLSVTLADLTNLKDHVARAIRHTSTLGPKLPRNNLIVLLRTATSTYTPGAHNDTFISPSCPSFHPVSTTHVRATSTFTDVHQACALSTGGYWDWVGADKVTFSPGFDQMAEPNHRFGLAFGKFAPRTRLNQTSAALHPPTNISDDKMICLFLRPNNCSVTKRTNYKLKMVFSKKMKMKIHQA